MQALTQLPSGSQVAFIVNYAAVLQMWRVACSLESYYDWGVGYCFGDLLSGVLPAIYNVYATSPSVIALPNGQLLMLQQMADGEPTGVYLSEDGFGFSWRPAQAIPGADPRAALHCLGDGPLRGQSGRRSAKCVLAGDRPAGRTSCNYSARRKARAGTYAPAASSLQATAAQAAALSRPVNITTETTIEEIPSHPRVP